VSSGTSLNVGDLEVSFDLLGNVAVDWAPAIIGASELIAGFYNNPGAAAAEYGGYVVDAGAGAIDSFVDTLNPFGPWVDIPNIGPVFGHEDAYFVGNVAGTIAGMAAGMSIGNIAAGTSSLVACGSLAQKAAKLYTAIDTVAGIANATSNIAAGNASLGDALAFLPVMTVGVQKLRGAPTNCFIAGTLVAVAGVGTADAGPSSASKPIEEIQVGDFVWARAEHDPSAPAVLQKVVALHRNTAHDLQKLEVVGDQGSAGPLGQSVQIVATDEYPFYVVDPDSVMPSPHQAGAARDADQADAVVHRARQRLPGRALRGRLRLRLAVEEQRHPAGEPALDPWPQFQRDLRRRRGLGDRRAELERFAPLRVIMSHRHPADKLLWPRLDHHPIGKQAGGEIDPLDPTFQLRLERVGRLLCPRRPLHEHS
jgi:hypothetical protein